MGKGKTNGINSAQNLSNRHKRNKKKPTKKEQTHFGGTVISMLRQQTHRRITKVVVVQLPNNKKIVARVPFDGGIRYLEENDEVVVQRTKHLGEQIIKYLVLSLKNIIDQVIKVKRISLLSIYQGKREKPR